MNDDLEATQTLSANDMLSQSELTGNDTFDNNTFAEQRADDDVSLTSSQEEARVAALLGIDLEDDDVTASQRRRRARNIGERLYRDGTGREQRLQERLRRLREQKLVDELAECTARPSITRFAGKKQATGSSFNTSIAWQQDKQRRILEQAEMMEKDETAENRPPQINPKSIEILKKKGYVDPVSGWEESFLKFAGRKSDDGQQYSFSPTINRSKLSSPGFGSQKSGAGNAAADRLFSDASKRHDKLQDLVTKHSYLEQLDQASGRPLFSPQLESSRQKRQLSTGDSSERLYTAAVDKRDRLTDLQRKANEEHSFKPKLTPKSQKLISKVADRKPIYQQSTPSRRSASPDPKQESSTAKKSRVVDVEGFWRRNERTVVLRNEQVAKIRQKHDEQETRECTFSPKLNNHSRQIFENSYGTQARDTPDAYTGDRSHTESSYRGGRSEPHDQSGDRNRSSRKTHSPPAQQQPRSSDAYQQRRVEHRRQNDRGDGNVDNFEQQMFALLDEWKKLEEV